MGPDDTVSQISIHVLAYSTRLLLNDLCSLLAVIERTEDSEMDWKEYYDFPQMLLGWKVYYLYHLRRAGLPIPNVARMEYILENDPGFGNKVPKDIPFTVTVEEGTEKKENAERFLTNLVKDGIAKASKHKRQETCVHFFNKMEKFKEEKLRMYGFTAETWVGLLGQVHYMLKHFKSETAEKVILTSLIDWRDAGIRFAFNFDDSVKIFSLDNGFLPPCDDTETTYHPNPMDSPFPRAPALP
eukprot:740397-Rhodomonas_salina.1